MILFRLFRSLQFHDVCQPVKVMWHGIFSFLHKSCQNLIRISQDSNTHMQTKLWHYVIVCYESLYFRYCLCINERISSPFKIACLFVCYEFLSFFFFLLHCVADSKCVNFVGVLVLVSVNSHCCFDALRNLWRRCFIFGKN